MKKPNLTFNKKYKQGKFAPKNPEKYIGNLNELVYRSSIELRYMKYFDQTPSVISWASEELHISYLNPIDKRVHQYFPDFLIKVKTNDGSIETVMVEIKPASQVKKPVLRKGKQKSFMTEMLTYEMNAAKWKYANEFCKKNGMKFAILTEDSIKIRE